MRTENTKLDAEVAKVVFRYTEIENVCGEWRYRNKVLAKERFGGIWTSPVPGYSASWEGVGLVVEEMKRKGWDCVINSWKKGGSVAFKKSERDVNWESRYVANRSLFVAVCEAALKARKEKP